MKEEELIKRIKETELPEIEIASHRRRLKTALLSTGCPERRQGFNLLDLPKAIIKGGKDIIMKGLLAKQPIWKTATIGITGLALILALSMVLPPLFSDSPYAKAADIVKNSPEVRAAFSVNGTEDIEVFNLFFVDADGTVSLLIKGKDDFMTAEVDLEAGKVVEVSPMSLSREEKEEAIRIAEADPRVKELLDKGATITRLAYVYTVAEEPVQLDKPYVTLLRAVIELDGESWTANINLDAKQVTDFGPRQETLTTGMTFGRYPGENMPLEETVTIEIVVDYPEDYAPPPSTLTPGPGEEAEEIALADPRVKELIDKGGRIAGGFQAAARMNAAGEIIEEASLSTIIIELDGQHWQVEVDLAKGEIAGPPVEADPSIMHGLYEPAQIPPAADRTQE